MPLQIRRGNTAEITSITPLIGELIYNTQTQKLHVGNGSTAGGIITSTYSDADAKDAAAASIAAGTHTNISFSYNSTTKHVRPSLKACCLKNTWYAKPEN